MLVAARSPRRLEKIARVLAHRQAGLTVVLENIHDPHNVSAIFRTCDAVGVIGVELLYTTEKFPMLGKKSSSSATKWVDRRPHRSIDECFALLRGEGMRILATRLEPGARTLYELDLTQPTAFVFGNEHRGVSDEAARKADECIRIPMCGMIESLNVSVAAAVCLYETLRQRLAAGMLERAQLPPKVLDALATAWRRK